MDPRWDAANLLPGLGISDDAKVLVNDLIWSGQIEPLTKFQEHLKKKGRLLESAVMYSIVQRMQGSNVVA